jgi:hypothetical protein
MVKILSGVHLVLFPIWAGGFLIKNREKLNKREIKAKFESLYLNLRRESKAQLIYPMVFLIRRMIFVLIATNWTKYPFFQVQAINFVNCLYFSFIGYFLPSQSHKTNKLELFNEFILQILFYHFFCFSEWETTSEIQYQIGHSFIAFTVFLMIVNIIGFGHDLIEPIKRWLYHRWVTKNLLEIKAKRE